MCKQKVYYNKLAQFDKMRVKFRNTAENFNLFECLNYQDISDKYFLKNTFIKAFMLTLTQFTELINILFQWEEALNRKYSSS